MPKDPTKGACHRYLRKHASDPPTPACGRVMGLPSRTIHDTGPLEKGKLPITKDKDGNSRPGTEFQVYDVNKGFTKYPSKFCYYNPEAQWFHNVDQEKFFGFWLKLNEMEWATFISDNTFQPPHSKILHDMMMTKIRRIITGTGVSGDLEFGLRDRVINAPPDDFYPGGRKFGEYPDQYIRYLSFEDMRKYQYNAALQAWEEYRDSFDLEKPEKPDENPNPNPNPDDDPDEEPDKKPDDEGNYDEEKGKDKDPTNKPKWDLSVFGVGPIGMQVTAVGGVLGAVLAEKYDEYGLLVDYGIISPFVAMIVSRFAGEPLSYDLGDYSRWWDDKYGNIEQYLQWIAGSVQQYTSGWYIQTVSILGIGVGLLYYQNPRRIYFYAYGGLSLVLPWIVSGLQQFWTDHRVVSTFIIGLTLTLGTSVLMFREHLLPNMAILEVLGGGGILTLIASFIAWISQYSFQDIYKWWLELTLSTLFNSILIILDKLFEFLGKLIGKLKFW